MKVAIYTYSVQSGAFSSYFSSLTLSLERHVDSIDILCTGKVDEDPVNRFSKNSHIYGLGKDRSLKAIFPIIKYLRKESPEILITGPTYINIISIIISLLSGWNGKLVITHHHPIALSHKDNFKNNKYLARILYRFSDFSFATTPYVMEEAIKETYIDRSAIFILPPAVSAPSLIDPLKKDETNSYGKYFVCMARLDPVKNHKLLISAFSSTCSLHDFNLVIVGRGGLKDELIQQVYEEKLQDRVKFTGFVDNPENIIRSSQALILSSNEEGFGQVIVEAMSLSIPVIATDASGGGPRYILDNGKYGLLVAMKDQKALSRAIMFFADDVNRDYYVKKSKIRSLDFTYQKNSDMLGDILHKIVGG